MANAVEGSKRQTKRAVIGDRPEFADLALGGGCRSDCQKECARLVNEELTAAGPGPAQPLRVHQRVRLEPETGGTEVRKPPSTVSTGTGSLAADTVASMWSTSASGSCSRPASRSR